MNFNQKEDVFSSTIKFQNDIIFTEITTIRNHLVYSILNNIKIISNFILRQTIDFSNENLQNIINNCGTFFNISTISKSISLLTDNELSTIASTFRASLMNSNFNSICNKIIEPIRVLLTFTKYFYLPVRINYETIPTNLQLLYLKHWLSSVCILISEEHYISKYIETIDSLDVYKNCFKQFLDKDENKRDIICQKMSKLSFEQIKNILIKLPNDQNLLHIFIHDFNNLFINMCIEIIQKFCPNYNVVRNINPKYNGIWLSPFDSDVKEQLDKLYTLF